MPIRSKIVTPQIAVVGSINTDLNVSLRQLPAPGETAIAQDSAFSPGGKGANQACSAAMLGGTVSLVSAVGDDSNQAIALEGLTAAGVDLSRVECLPGSSTGRAMVMSNSKGENSIVVIPGANYEVSVELVRSHATLIEDADVVIVQAEIPPASLEAAVELARNRIVVNLAPYTDVSMATLRKANPLVVNEHEAQSLHEAHGFAAVARQNYAALARDLMSLGIASLVITLGAEGALIMIRQGSEFYVPACPVQTLDTTGAGDAFVGALAFMLGGGSDLETSVRYATRVAAYSVQRPGAQGSYPSAGVPLPKLAEQSGVLVGES